MFDGQGGQLLETKYFLAQLPKRKIIIAKLRKFVKKHPMLDKKSAKKQQRSDCYIFSLSFFRMLWGQKHIHNIYISLKVDNRGNEPTLSVSCGTCAEGVFYIGKTRTYNHPHARIETQEPWHCSGKSFRHAVEELN